jgi:hypothetical protein
MPDKTKSLSFLQILLQNGIPFKTIRNIGFADWKNRFIALPQIHIKDNLSFNSSGAFDISCKIPQINIYREYDTEPKIKGVFDNFPLFKFGGIPFTCSHGNLGEFGIISGIASDADRNMFNVQYGINLDKVYISLNELSSVAGFSGVFSEIDDFIVVGNNDNTLLTIIDNDLDYSAKYSHEKRECHFQPVLCIDRAVPVKYIKTADDAKPFHNQQIPERRIEYNLQRNQTLEKLNNIFSQTTHNQIYGFPTDIDFVAKTGLHEFTILNYNRFGTRVDFWITNVRCDTNDGNPKTVIKKCNFQNLPDAINNIQRARATHFDKMYGNKNR